MSELQLSNSFDILLTTHHSRPSCRLVSYAARYDTYRCCSCLDYRACEDASVWWIMDVDVKCSKSSRTSHSNRVSVRVFRRASITTLCVCFFRFTSSLSATH